MAKIDDLLDEVPRIKQEQERQHRLLHTIRELIVALTANEQQAVNDLSSAVETMATDLANVLSSAQAVQTTLQAQIDQLRANHSIDQAAIDGLQAQVNTMETEVVGALQPLTDRVNQIDSGLKSPATPTSPLTATS
jgi:chromosome segregation ATPase